MSTFFPPSTVSAPSELRRAGRTAARGAAVARGGAAWGGAHHRVEVGMGHGVEAAERWGGVGAMAYGGGRCGGVGRHVA